MKLENAIDSKSTLMTRAINVILPLLGLWAMISLTISIAVTFSEYQKQNKENVVLFKSTCISEKGKIRHDRWAFGVDLYCQKPKGDETLFRSSTNVSYNWFLADFTDRIFFNIFEVRKLLK